jgi:hypothetical protein
LKRNLANLPVFSRILTQIAKIGRSARRECLKKGGEVAEDSDVHGTARVERTDFAARRLENDLRENRIYANLFRL